MSIASTLKRLNRKTITLPINDPETGEPLTVVIRRVRAGEVTARAGSPLSLLAAARNADPGETPEQYRERVLKQALADPQLFAETVEYGQRMQAAVVSLGVISEKVVDKSEHELAEDEVLPEHFGDALPMLYNAIIEFSNLPYQPLEGADLTRFRQQSVARDILSDGGEVRN